MSERFVFFDVGGTLIHPNPSVGHVYQSAGAQFGLQATPEDIERAFRAVWKRHNDNRSARAGVDDAATRAWWRGIVDEVFDRVSFDGDRAAAFDACYEAFAKADAWAIFDDVQPTLQELRARGVPMGVLSNWDHRLPPLLETLELDHYFESIIVSAIVGAEKPSPMIYENARDAVGRPYEELVYVGDQRPLDVTPARALGITAFLIDRRGGGEDSIDSLQRLLDLDGLR